jgi:hypothetical protein
MELLLVLVSTTVTLGMPSDERSRRWQSDRRLFSIPFDFLTIVSYILCRRSSIFTTPTTKCYAISTPPIDRSSVTHEINTSKFGGPVIVTIETKFHLSSVIMHRHSESWIAIIQAMPSGRPGHCGSRVKWAKWANNALLTGLSDHPSSSKCEMMSRFHPSLA